jgi:hypothetical protein
MLLYRQGLRQGLLGQHWAAGQPGGLLRLPGQGLLGQARRARQAWPALLLMPGGLGRTLGPALLLLGACLLLLLLQALVHVLSEVEQ